VLVKTATKDLRDSADDREGDFTSETQHARDAAGNVVDGT
jgi:hypothetical protein